MTDKEKLERYEKKNTGIRPKYHKGNHIKEYQRRQKENDSAAFLMIQIQAESSLLGRL